MSLIRSIGSATPEGLTDIGGEQFYVIPAAELMSPFLMSVVSDGDRWMFVSSEGGLTAGRGQAERALFPYETDDRLHESSGVSGPVTSLRVPGAHGIWRPFQAREHMSVGRRIAKSVVGDAVIFEEDHPEIPLTIGYSWDSCEEFGFIRTAHIVNNGSTPIKVEVIDGLLNVNPYGLDLGIQHGMRNLSHAYKRSEVIDEGSRFSLFSLESQIADRPEPTEVLRATTIWSYGPDGFGLTLDGRAVLDFERGSTFVSRSLVTGRPGAYLLSGELLLEPGERASWFIVCDVARDHAEIQAILSAVRSASDLEALMVTAVSHGRHRLVDLMASSDASAVTEDGPACANQVANVTYNVMRGGIPVDGYLIDCADFRRFLETRNRQIFSTHQSLFASLPDSIPLDELLKQISTAGSPQVLRLAYEYLPFAFSRRHGDPSRPWNRFSIQVRDDYGNPVRHYEGNWRDIFQNWEALCLSFPGFLTSVISVFVNASTIDGFNPYRISRTGIDWEVPEPDQPWSNIGYWGDHQIAYLLALLEESEQYQPGAVAQLLNECQYSTADVPYRIASYQDLIRNPKSTILFDESAHQESMSRAADVGGDGRLRWQGGDVWLTTLAEKLLIPALSKLGNFVPGGGIWMNTQRPEWNDANNALVGHGLSMVTLFYLRRYLTHLSSLFEGHDSVELSCEVNEWLSATADILLRERPAAESPDTAEQHRRRVMEALGEAFSSYRSKVFSAESSQRCSVQREGIQRLCSSAIAHLDATIASARRSDGLFHSYNILHIDPAGQTASVEHLPVMLEGQVAALGAGFMAPSESAALIEAMFDSRLYRSDARSFLLYPAEIPRSFMEKNQIAEEEVAAVPLLRELESRGDRSLIVRDPAGGLRFHADVLDSATLARVLKELAENDDIRDLVEQSSGDVTALFQRVFGHHAYTGRSSSMYAYEGIGSIYWHMVAKLLVAIQSTISSSVDSGHDNEGVERLVDLYWQVRKGSGRSKSASDWGAIPTDPYSHSPSHGGAQQPGMTGLAKEEVLARPYELGLRVRNGRICVDPTLLNKAEFLTTRRTWRFIGLDHEEREIELPVGSLAFTVCQVPVVVHERGEEPGIRIAIGEQSTRRDDFVLDPDISSEVFSRSGRVSLIEVTLAR